MVMSYGGQQVRFLDRFRRKSALPIPEPARSQFTWTPASWLNKDFANFVEYGYRGNSAVFACIQALAIGFSEPPLAVYETATREKVPEGKHPLYNLFRRPNPLMGQKELWMYHMTYEPLGGNAYITQYKSPGQRTVELWPYHAGQVWPVPDLSPEPESWIKEFRYDLGSNTSRPLGVKDVIHTKWMPDIDYPWRGQAALEATWKEIQTDNELTRMLKALLQNDAVPRTAVTMPEKAGVVLNEEFVEKVRRQFRLKFGGDNRGDVAILAAGTTLSRVALNLQELQLETIRYIPETRIAADFHVPIQIAGLYAGIDKSTYNNMEEAGRWFTEKTLMPKWELLADELTHNLVPEYDPQGRIYLAFDMSRVAALKENIDAKAVWVVSGWEKGLLRRNTCLSLLGLEVERGPDGDEYKAAPAPAPIMQPALNAPPTDAQTQEQQQQIGKAVMALLETKELSPAAHKIERQIAGKMETHLRDTYSKVATSIGGGRNGAS